MGGGLRSGSIFAEDPSLSCQFRTLARGRPAARQASVIRLMPPHQRAQAGTESPDPLKHQLLPEHPILERLALLVAAYPNGSPSMLSAYLDPLGKKRISEGKVASWMGQVAGSE